MEQLRNLLLGTVIALPACGLVRGCQEGQENLFLPKKEIVVKDTDPLQHYNTCAYAWIGPKPTFRDTFEITTKPAILSPFGDRVTERLIGAETEASHNARMGRDTIFV